jgi:multidrug efflux pump subunit AcrA (membrane-fusion protein)
MNQIACPTRLVSKSSLLAFVALLGVPAMLARADGGGVLESGITLPNKEIELRFKYQGLIKEVNVEEGDILSKGQVNGKDQRVLVVQDNLEEKAELDAMSMDVSTEVTVDAAKANLEQKKLEMQKAQQVHDGGAGSDLELAKAKTDVEVARLQVVKEQQDLEVKRLKLNKQKALLDKMEILNNVDGVVQSVSVHAGEMVDPNKPPAVVIVQNDPLLVQIQLAPSVAKNLKIGRALRVSYDRLKWEEATVYYLAPKADAASNLQAIKLKLPNPNGVASGAQISVEVPADIVALSGNAPAAR